MTNVALVLYKNHRSHESCVRWLDCLDDVTLAGWAWGLDERLLLAWMMAGALAAFFSYLNLVCTMYDTINNGQKLTLYNSFSCLTVTHHS